MKLAIIGSRDFTDFEEADAQFSSRYLDTYGPLVDQIISGGAAGSDTIARKVISMTKDTIELERDYHVLYTGKLGDLTRDFERESLDALVVWSKSKENRRKTIYKHKIRFEVENIKDELDTYFKQPKAERVIYLDIYWQ